MKQVEEIKQKIDIADLVSEYVTLKRAGRNFKGLCPFHGEKSPSFMVNPELQIYKCFGCGEGGDVFSFLQKIEGMEFGEAIALLAKRVGITLESYKPSKNEELKEKIVRINGVAAEYFHFLLIKHKLGEEAKKYVLGRGISEEMIEKFRLGFAPDGWDYLLKFLTEKKRYLEADIEAAGLIARGRGAYDRFRNRVMFPLTNHRGLVVGFSGRVMPGADEKSGGKYVNTSETLVYHKSELLYGFDITRAEIKAKKFVVVVEGELDAIASYQSGVKNVVAIKGSAFTVGQVEILRRVTDTVVLALDADLAGDMAARRGIEVAEKAGLIIKVATHKSSYKDPGEMAIAEPELWKKIVMEAIPIYDFYIDSSVARYGVDVVGKRRVGQELLPIFSRIDDEIVKAHYVKKLADMLGVGVPAINEQMGKMTVKSKPVQEARPEEKSEIRRPRREILEEYLVGLAIKLKKVQLLTDADNGLVFKSPFWTKVIGELAQVYDATESVAGLVAKIPAELRERVQLLLLRDEEEVDLDKEWEKAKMELEEIGIREKLEEYRGEEGRLAEVVELTKRLSELTKRR